MTDEIKKAIEIVKAYLDMDSDVDSEYLNAQRTIIQALEAQSFINKPCVSEGVCREDKIQVLDKIREEIKQAAFNDVHGSKYIFINRVDQIIDKYKAEK
jgi:hypothetical protein